MLTFFRRIRKGLLGSGQARKPASSHVPSEPEGKVEMPVSTRVERYLMYAIGEILLVTIGILLALQINNWNEDRKDRITEKNLLIALHANLKEDTTLQNNQIENYRNMQRSAETIRNHLSSNLPYDSSLAYHFAQIGISFNYTPDQAVFESIKEHGINIIQNEELRLAISEYYQEADFLNYASDLYSLSRHFRENIYPKYFKNYRWARHATPVDYSSLRTKTDFLMALDYALNDTGFYQGQYRNMKSRATRILRLIHENLQSVADFNEHH